MIKKSLHLVVKYFTSSFDYEDGWTKSYNEINFTRSAMHESWYQTLKCPLQKNLKIGLAATKWKWHIFDQIYILRLSNSAK